MKINFTKKQYEQLIKLVYLGNWMANAIRSDRTYKEFDDLESYILSFSKNFNLEKFAELDSNSDGRYYPTSNLEDDPTITKLLEEYDEETFWEELTDRLTAREFAKKYTKAQVKKMNQKQHFLNFCELKDQVEEILEDEGLDTLKFQLNQSKPTNKQFTHLLPNVKITNSHRKKQIEEFMDQSRKVMYQYYDLQESNLSDAKKQQKLEQLIEADPDFYDTYIDLANIFEASGEQEKARQLIITGFQKAMKRIVDNQGRFPKAMPWGWLENRHLIRIIYQQAFDCWTWGDTESALYLLRNLLHFNPNDNIGARSDILAIRMGLGPDYIQQFITKDTLPGCIDGKLSMDWFDKNSKKYPEEFDWWKKIVNDEE